MKKKNLKWTDIWHLPLWYDGYDCAWTKTEDGELVMALTFEEDYKTNERGEEHCTGRNKHLVSVINGECPNDTAGKWTVKNGCNIYDCDEYIFCCRGWGHLTGVLKLTSTEAIRIQDEFIAYILDKLNKVEL